MEIDELKATVCAEVDRWGDRLIDVAHEIHAHPELAYEEHAAHDLLTSVLDDAALGAGAGGLRGADRVPGRGRRSEGPTVAVLCEYDALPEIGHACGHNVIATAGLGAGLAAAALADEARRPARRARHPGRGGRRRQDRAGPTRRLRPAIDAAMMVHPADADLTRMDCLAIQQLEVAYQGEAAHAASAPHRRAATPSTPPCSAT